MSVLRLSLLQLSLLALFSSGQALASDPSTLDPASRVLQTIDQANNQSLLWGPYKPNLYLGVRPRIPEALSVGLLWSEINDYGILQSSKLRYTCEQHQGIFGYGWEEYDVRKGGRQTIHDEDNGLDLTTSFVKIPGGDHGGSWAIRVKGTPRPSASPHTKTMLVVYLAQEENGGLQMSVDSEKQASRLGVTGDLLFYDETPSLGRYQLVITEGTGAKPACGNHPSCAQRRTDTTTVHSANHPPDKAWRGADVVLESIFEEGKQLVDEYPDNVPPPWATLRKSHDPLARATTHQVQKFFRGEFEFDIIFTSLPKESSDDSSSDHAEKGLSSDVVTEEIEKALSEFRTEFSQRFPLQEPFQEEEHVRFGKSMLSNLLGGIGYFHGSHLVDRSDARAYEETSENFWLETEEAKKQNPPKLEGPHELFTSIPSRPFFPRGFLWDEGFHLLTITDWDMDLALEIVRSWLRLMDEDGWIAREQILGDEPRSKVPPEFAVQYPHHANPPTLFLILEKFVHQIQLRAEQKTSADPEAEPKVAPRSALLEHPEAGRKFLQDVYPLLQRQYDWFRRTQKGEIVGYGRDALNPREAYRWRGRTETHCLASGLDDYPRPQPPHPAELHVDLLSWVGLMAKSLGKIAEALGEEDDAKRYRGHLKGVQQNLVALHWSDGEKSFCDASIDEFEENELVCHKGYVSMMPFLLGLLDPEDGKLSALLDQISDPEQLWSEHGLRSLSVQDAAYGTGENYWRGPIWMNVNYLALTQLHALATRTMGTNPHRDRARDLYNRLRENLVETVLASWRETGFAWEQYHPETGAGQRTQHFTGWTSLVVKMMTMPHLPERVFHDEL